VAMEIEQTLEAIPRHSHGTQQPAATARRPLLRQTLEERQPDVALEVQLHRAGTYSGENQTTLQLL